MALSSLFWFAVAKPGFQVRHVRCSGCDAFHTINVPVVATSMPAEPNATAWQRFLPTGPLALLPVRDGYSNIVWSTSPDLANALEAMAPQEFAAAVNKVDTGGGGITCVLVVVVVFGSA
jgi:hypothetical protein